MLGLYATSRYSAVFTGRADLLFTLIDVSASFQSNQLLFSQYSIKKSIWANLLRNDEKKSGLSKKCFEWFPCCKPGFKGPMLTDNEKLWTCLKL